MEGVELSGRWPGSCSGLLCKTDMHVVSKKAATPFAGSLGVPAAFHRR